MAPDRKSKRIGAHWLTDVLASLLLGAGWLAVVLLASGLLGADATARSQPPPARGHLGGPEQRGPRDADAALLNPVPPRWAAVVLLTGVGGPTLVGCALAALARSLVPDLAVTGVDADVTGYLVANLVRG